MSKTKYYNKIGEHVFTGKLENGLSVTVVPKQGFKKAMAFFATNYGGADRRFRLSGEWIDTPAGVAHFLEHKMFDMENGDNALTLLSERGASANAFTSSGMTAYYFESTEGFADNLRLLLQFVSTPYFTEESVDKEQGIIGQEIRMTEDNPEYSIYHNFMKLLFRENPVRDSVAGTVESIGEITAETLYNCHKVFYNPSNMSLCVVGDVKPEEVMEIAREVLTMPAGEQPARDYGTEPAGGPETTRSLQIMDVGTPMFLAGSKVESEKSGQAYLRQELLGELALAVFAGKASPLYERLYNDGLITSDFTAEFEKTAGIACVMFSGESRDPEAVLEEILKEAEHVANVGVDEELFARRKKAAVGSNIRGLNSFDNICYTVSIGNFNGFDPFESIQILSGFTASDVTEFIRAHITREKTAMAVVRAAE